MEFDGVDFVDDFSQGDPGLANGHGEYFTSSSNFILSYLKSCFAKIAES